MPMVGTDAPAGSPPFIGPYNHIAKSGSLVTIGAIGSHRPARTVISAKKLPKPGFRGPMNLMATTAG